MAVTRQPDLVLEHADAYLGLATAELDEWHADWKHRASLGTAAALLAYLGLALAGGAGLALAVIPVDAMPMPWLLGLIPAIPWLGAALLAWRLRHMNKVRPFQALREQLAQDLATLRILDKE